MFILFCRQNGHTNIVRALLKCQGINVNVCGMVDATPLHQASQNGHIGIVRLLLDRDDIDVNSPRNQISYLEPLYFAAKFKHMAIVKLLWHRTHVSWRALIPASEDEEDEYEVNNM